MTGQVIPAEQWPEDAHLHTWDSNGLGNWLRPSYGAWHLWASDIPLPAGHDWRVPVMRPVALGSSVPVAVIPTGHPTSVVQWLGPMPPQGTYLYAAPQPAPAIDLEQFRGAFVALSDYAYERHGNMDHPHCLEADRLLALIDGSPKGAAPELQVPAAAPEVVAYLDIGAGGYLDLGSDLSDEQLLALPKGRHALAIIGTFGIDGYVAASPTVTDPVAAYERELAAGATHEHALHAICTPAVPGIDLGQFRQAVEYWKLRWAKNGDLLVEANRLLALIDGQPNDNGVRVDRGALQMAINVLRRAGKGEVADALAGGVIKQPSKGEGE